MYEPTSWRPHMPGGVHERAGRQQCAVAGRRRVLPHHVSGARLGPGLRQLTRAAPCACRRAQRRLHAPRQNRERKSDRSLPARPASAHPPRAARQPGGGPRRVRRARGRARRCAAQVRSPAESAARIAAEALAQPADAALVLAAHNGPAGLGGRRHSICGADFLAQEARAPRARRALVQQSLHHSVLCGAAPAAHWRRAGRLHTHLLGSLLARAVTALRLSARFRGSR